MSKRKTLPRVLKRKPSRIRQLRRILIVCEGKKTEPNYFKSFPANPEVFDRLEIEGLGMNTVSLVEEAIALKQEAEKNRTPYIETWAVFDRDDFPLENFKKALNLAEKNNVRCAYSIESFELWYLLHFGYFDSKLSRKEYCEKLTTHLRTYYKKNDPDIYRKLHGRMKTAIKNATTLYDRQSTKKLTDQNPITLVFQLVQRLEE